MSFSQVKIGAIFSYILIALNAIYNLFITPYVLGCLGSEDFGVYQAMTSLTTSLMVFDLGMGGTVMRYIAKFIEEKKYKEISNFVCMSFIQAGVIVIILLFVSSIIYYKLGDIFDGGMSLDNIVVCKKLFIIQIAILAAHIIENILNGIITGYNRFAFGNGIKVIRIISRAILVYSFVYLYPSPETLVLVDLVIILLMLIMELIYIKRVLHFQYNYYYWDGSLFKESFYYTICLFLTSIVMQVNSNAANILIGAMKGPVLVAIYSMAVLINNMFCQLSSSVSGVLLPTAMNKIMSCQTKEEEVDIVQRFIIKVGRVQFAILGLFVCFFIAFGKDFILLWLGDKFIDVYYLSIVLMLPVLLELCVNVCVTILRVKNKLVFRTIVLSLGALITVIFSILGLKFSSYYSVAYATGLGTFISSVIVMNIYYFKVFHYNMIYVYIKIFSRLLPSFLLILVIAFGINHLFTLSWLNLFIECLLMGIISLPIIYWGGLNKDEKSMFSLKRLV